MMLSSRQPMLSSAPACQKLIASLFLGREIELEYEVTGLAPPSRVVLEASTPQFRGVDTISFEELPSGTTRVSYDAVFRFNGWMRLVEPLMRPSLRCLVRDALDGLVASYGRERMPGSGP